MLSTIYEAGARQLNKNPQAATKLFRLAAEQGLAVAQERLGCCYDECFPFKGVKKDESEAVKLYRLAAEQGDAYAQSNLGSLEMDDNQGVRWAKLAADQGECTAQGNLGNRYANGNGVPQDLEQAAPWLKLTARQGGAAARDSYRRVLTEMLRMKQESEDPEESTEGGHRTASIDQPAVPKSGKRDCCNVCGKPVSFLCTRCKKAWHCSAEHQASDWTNGHRRACQALAGTLETDRNNN